MWQSLLGLVYKNIPNRIIHICPEQILSQMAVSPQELFNINQRGVYVIRKKLEASESGKVARKVEAEVGDPHLLLAIGSLKSWLLSTAFYEPGPRGWPNYRGSRRASASSFGPHSWLIPQSPHQVSIHPSITCHLWHYSIGVPLCGMTHSAGGCNIT